MVKTNVLSINQWKVDKPYLRFHQKKTPTLATKPRICSFFSYIYLFLRFVYYFFLYVFTLLWRGHHQEILLIKTRIVEVFDIIQY